MQVLIARRDRILRTWLTGLNPIDKVTLDPNGQLRFENAAERAGVIGPGQTWYALTWSRFDNATDVLTPVPGPENPAGAAATTDPRGTLPATLANSPWVAVSIHSTHADYPHWKLPVTVYFRRQGGSWQTVGLDRATPERSARR